jgi:mRNA interferase RelE/StbE
VSYRLEILRRAQKELESLPQQDFERVRNAIQALAVDPRPPGCRKLSGREGWRIRVGQYRVIYEIQDQVRVLTVLDVGHRREVYRP